ncbi:EAL domain-containing protein [Mongoliimonas terrestris]|uniref:EAL domain-containing protein n=1 Tax=Mongoliimonas terrestris TaxID=1709001 RepID=UPI0009497271|nr:EAL domain-containing protein [Mongoliimonas terrestris]
MAPTDLTFSLGAGGPQTHRPPAATSRRGALEAPAIFLGSAVLATTTLMLDGGAIVAPYLDQLGVGPVDSRLLGAGILAAGVVLAAIRIRTRSRRALPPPMLAPVARGDLDHSRRDPVTGLFNRRHLADFLAQRILRMEDHGGTLALLLVTLPASDRADGPDPETERAAARQLGAVVADDSMLARLGPSRFAVVIDRDADLDRGLAVGRAILADFGTDRASQPVAVALALYPDHARSSDDLIRLAEEAVALPVPTDDGRPHPGVRLPDRLPFTRITPRQRAFRDALSDREIGNAYRPLFSLRTLDLPLFEAVPVWESAEEGALTPAEILALAADAKRVPDLWARMLDEACRDLAGWTAETSVLLDLPDPLIAVADWTATAPDDPAAASAGPVGLPAVMAAAAARAGIATDRLVIGLGEDGVAADPRRADAVAAAFRAEGFRLCLTRFGGGDCGPRQIARLPVAYARLDAALFDAARQSEADARAAAAVVALGRSLGAEIIADGLGDAADVTLAERLGCTMGQGDFIAPPVSGRDVPALQRAAVIGDPPETEVNIVRERVENERK